MKKSSMEALVNHLNDVIEKAGDDSITADDLGPIRDELVAELAKGKAKAEANRALYAEMHDKVMNALELAPEGASVAEICNETKLPRGKVVYGLTDYWADEVEKDTSGKVTIYRKKA